MNNNKGIILGVIVLVLIAGGVYASMNGKDSDMMASDIKSGDQAMVEKKSDNMVKAGTYEAYLAESVAMASDTHDVVLFFRASWCPTCRALDSDINLNSKMIPASLSILDVDYDKSTDLKKKYSVTYQHTFVQVDNKGNLIKKWSGSPTLAALVAELK